MAPGDLQEVLLALEGQDGVAPETARDLLVGLGRADDAAVFRITDDVAIVETVDFFPPVVDDPYTWGAVAAANAMSDVYAMGGEVLFALAVAGFPRELDRTVIAEVFRGGADKVREAGGVIAGGHTVVDAEPKYGLCVTGRVHPDRILIKGGLRPGDRLFLSKPLGTGVVTTAAKAAVAGDEALTAAVTSMLRLNRAAALVALAHGARGATDITGFGLLGHLGNILAASGVGARLAFSRFPLLPGALELAARGAIPGGTRRNYESASVEWDGSLTEPERLLAVDAQTSGGLLLAVPADRLDGLLGALEREGSPARAVIGEITRETSLTVGR
jgi:selenide,water dikinase